MKKTILAVLIGAALTLSLAGCGENESAPASTPASSGKPASTPASSSKPVSSSAPASSKAPESSAPEESSDAEIKFPDAFSSIERVGVEDLENSTWMLMGGYSAGAELDDAGLQAVLAQYGGQLTLFFTADKASMDSGAGDHTEFDYTLSEQNSRLDLKGEHQDMTAIFMEQNGIAIMAAMSSGSADMVLYFATDVG